MDTLKIDKSKAKRLYKTASTELKEMLEDTFGKEFFSENIIDKIKTFKDAIDSLPKDDLDVVSYYEMCNAHITSKHATSYIKIVIIIKALNEGWSPNWNDSNEAKYYPWFSFVSGFGFSNSDYDCTNANADVGSRLCFKSRELSDYAGKQFQSIYNNYLNFN